LRLRVRHLLVVVRTVLAARWDRDPHGAVSG